jgi:hypothetical protein
MYETAAQQKERQIKVDQFLEEYTKKLGVHDEVNTYVNFVKSF